MNVSVVIPCYNQAAFLREAIESALGQTHAPAEVIVVNDGSTDDTEEVARHYREVTYISQENQGLCAAREAGYKASSGDFLVFLDADDRLMPDSIATGLTALSTAPGAAFAYGRLQRISLHGTVIGTRAEPPRSDYYGDMLEGNYISTPGMVLFRRSCLEKHGLFDPEHPATADYDLYLRIMRYDAVVSHDNVTVQRRNHPESMSRNAARMLKSALCVHRRQWPFARHREDWRSSYANGRKFWKQLYGRQLATALRLLRLKREWRAFFRGVLTLARYAPRSLPDALSRPRFSNLLEFTSAGAVGRSDGMDATKQNEDDASGPLQFVAFREVPPKTYRGVGYLEGIRIFTIDCRGARRGTLLSIGPVLFDTVFVSRRRLLAYLPSETVLQNEGQPIRLLG